MPVRFRPRVGPFVWSPSRRGPSVGGAVLAAVVCLVVLVALLWAVIGR